MSQLVTTGHVFEVPSLIAVCPYCHSHLRAKVNCWTQQDGGSWLATAIGVQCHSEPEIGSGEWLTWLQTHSHEPLVYQLPMDALILTWVNSNFSFSTDYASLIAEESEEPTELW